MWLIADLQGAVRQIVGIDPDAVAAYQAGAEVEEVPLGVGGIEHVVDRQPKAVEDLGDLVDERDVDVALGILDDLSGLGGGDVARHEDAGLGHLAIDFG